MELLLNIMRIETIKITKAYNGRVLFDKLSYNFEEGSVTELIGKNGSGKTTLLKIIAGIRKQDQGQVKYIKNNSELSYDKAKAQIIYTGNGEYLIPEFSIVEYFEFLRYAYKKDKLLFERLYVSLFSEFGIDIKESGKKIKDLSKGYQNLMEIIGGILVNPDVFILDEPFSNLDPFFVSIVKNKFVELKKQNKTIILSAHEELYLNSDQIYL